MQNVTSLPNERLSNGLPGGSPSDLTLIATVKEGSDITGLARQTHRSEGSGGSEASWSVLLTEQIVK